MIDTSKDGGPAFPQTFMLEGDEVHCFGISIRDYFAAHAPAVPDDFGWADGETDCYQRTIRWGWFYADAMLEARK